MNNATAPTVTYTAEVTPLLEGLVVRYEVAVYAMRPAGVCGPVTNVHSCHSLTNVDDTLKHLGFIRTAPYGAVCANGFASAPVELK